MAKYRKKPVVVEAVQWDGSNINDVFTLTHGAFAGFSHKGSALEIETREGAMTASPGDWIIREPFPTNDRQFYPCKPEQFEATYEPVEEPDHA